MPAQVDRLFVHCRELLTLADGPATGLRRGAALHQLGAIDDGAIAVTEGRIVATGTTDALRAEYSGARELDLSGFVVLPGFVDALTRPVWCGWGHDAVPAVRAASLEDLTAAVRGRLDELVANGTTAVEARTGFGLATDAETKSATALDVACRDHPMTVHRTFGGARAVPDEYRADRAGYATLVADEMLPAVRGLCDSCEVMAEPGALEREHTLRIIAAARDLGLGVRATADVTTMGGTELALEAGVDVVSHLAHISLGARRMLASSPAVAVLLPATTFGAGHGAHAPGRALIDQGCAVALASDLGPLGCRSASMPSVMALAAVLMRMTVPECISASTINAAAALGLDGELGSLHDGKRADFVALDLASFRDLGSTLGGNPVALTVIGGEPVVAQVHDRGLGV